MLAISFGAATAFAGGEDFRQIKGDELLTMFNGKTVVGQYNHKYYPDGALHFRETHNINGTTDYSDESGLTFKTKWNIIGGDKVCYTFVDSDGETHCFAFYLNDGCIYSYYAPFMIPNGPKSWGDWAFKSVIKGSGNSCAEPVS